MVTPRILQDMRESVFRFKQFNVQNKLSAMKVGTDGVLIGAWCDINDVKGSILDIGAGTGLISLMVAQRCKAMITAVEIDAIASNEANENIRNSQWNERISLVNVPFDEFVKNCNIKFEHIVSNPPFYENGLQSPNIGRTLARHTSSLSYNELLSGAKSLLSQTGRISIITPFDAKDTITNIATDNGLMIAKMTVVYPTPLAIPKRILWEFSFMSTATTTDDLIIEIERHKYSAKYIELTKEFYLKM